MQSPWMTESPISKHHASIQAIDLMEPIIGDSILLSSSYIDGLSNGENAKAILLSQSQASIHVGPYHQLQVHKSISGASKQSKQTPCATPDACNSCLMSTSQH